MSTASATELPEVVADEVLAFLGVRDLLALERVDRAWRRTLTDARHWRQVALEHEPDDKRSVATMREVAERHGAQVQRLTLAGCSLANNAVEAAAKQFKGLTHLVVSGCLMLSDDGFSALVCASRESLVDVCAVKCLQLTDASLRVLGERHSQSLERVNFSYCRQISSGGIATLARACCKLRSISLKGCPTANSAVVVVIAESCSTLETLALGGAGNVTDAALLAVASNCPGLTSLDIARSNPFGMGRGGITDSTLAHLALRCPELKHLVLCGQGQLSPSALGSLAASCPKLESLDLDGCRGIIANPIALGAQLRLMHSLRQLSIAFTRGLTNEHVDFIATQCPQLKIFHVDGSPVGITHA